MSKINNRLWTKKSLIPIVKAEYGLTASDAEKYILSASEETLQALWEGFKNNAKKAFYND